MWGQENVWRPRGRCDAFVCEGVNEKTRAEKAPLFIRRPCEIGYLAQRAGKRLHLIAAVGVFALGCGCLYAARTGPESTYATSLLPALVIRGFGIPLFQTCATLALLAAVPQSKVGLASGTLGMARNVGTAFGVAMLGIVYHGQIAGALPARLGDLPPGAHAARH